VVNVPFSDGNRNPAKASSEFSRVKNVTDTFVDGDFKRGGNAYSISV